MATADHHPDSSAAGELADVVAHGLTAIAIQAEAAERVLRSDPRRAAGPLAQIRASALEALADVRRLAGVLRDPDGCPERRPQPGLAELPALVEGARAAGQAVAYACEGESRPVPASLGLAVYRVVQRALEGAALHAPGAAVAVQVRWTAGAVAVEVTDPGGGSRDTACLRERVALHSGRLEAGPAASGGYRVLAVFAA